MTEKYEGETRRKKRRRRMKKFTINELSAVDRPAQEGALMTIMKRDDEDDADSSIEKNAVPVMTTAEEGHSHLVWLSGDRGGETSLQRSEGEDMHHDHPWVVEPDGSIRIGENDGHTHEISQESVLAAMRELISEETSIATADVVFAQHEDGAPFLEDDFPIRTVSDLRNAIDVWGHADNQDRVAGYIQKRARVLDLESELPDEFTESIAQAVGPVDGDHGKDSEMTTRAKAVKKTAEDDAVKKTADDGDSQELEALRAELEVAKALGTLTDEQKVHFGKLDETGQAAFLQKDPGQREAEIVKLHATREVVYTATDGSEYTKSDDPRLVAAVRQSDDTAKELALAKAERRDVEYTKRAEDDFDNLPGELAPRVALLKAVDTIEDEELREGVLEMLKALQTARAGAFERQGVHHEGGGETADEKLTEMAKRYQEEHPGTSFVDAYENVGMANPELREAAVFGN